MRKEEKYRQENQERLCYCCDTFQPSKDNINTYRIYMRGYGSIFDNCDFTIQLCDKCKQQINKKWFYEQPTMLHEYCEEYKYEKELDNFIHTFPIQNQEYIYNHMNGYTMDRSDWIAMKKGNLPEFKYKEYGMYSPLEINAYKERFPTCEYPVIRKYKDGSQGCWCPIAITFAHGDIEENKIVPSLNISQDCYYCKNYKLRTSNIKTILDIDFDDYELYMKSNLKMNELKEKFE